MEKLRIAFFGTPDFAVGSLRALLREDFEVVVVVTAPDRPAGRGRKLQASAVKTFALQQHIPVLQPENLKDPSFLETLKGYRVNLQVIVAFRMLPRVVWALPEFGTFNLHASLLPDYRGAAPINWAIIRGEAQTGVTTFFIDEQIDTGNIILQKKTDILADETAGQLHDRLMELGAELVVETVRQIEQGNATTQAQDMSKTYQKAPKLNRENCQLDWTQAAVKIHNKIRGLSPYPGAWSFFQNNGEEEIVKIFASRPTEKNCNMDAGRILVEGNQLFVQCGKGMLEVLEMQLPGKRKMAVKDLLNGYTVAEIAKFC
ncbi:methionyl-tRNA formyltransferase [Robiginitalea sp. IMCC43444]|uniref:methionyl-tRNA formyltransferase n=1 Tax=Robiginitalea sp. IMCC43444 TaxID=3459121 RepID=UPI0040426E9A